MEQAVVEMDHNPQHQQLLVQLTLAAVVEVEQEKHLVQAVQV